MTGSTVKQVSLVLDRVESERSRAQERLFELLRIPSVSTQPEHRKDIGDAAEWLRSQLAELGFEVGIRPTPGHPIVLGHHPGPTWTKAPPISSRAARWTTRASS